MITSSSLVSKFRPQVIQLYKQLLFLANDYPGKEPSEVKEKIKNAFRKNRDLSSDAEIQAAIDRGEYIKKEIESLIFLARYRELKRRYNNESEISEYTSSYEEIKDQGREIENTE